MIKLVDELNTRWNNQPVKEYRGDLTDVLGLLPEFKSKSFGEGKNANPNLRQIVRLPIGKDNRIIPVAVVSNRYALIQHRQIVENFQYAIQEAGFNISSLTARLLISEFGERIYLSVEMPNFDFNPGDDYDISMNLNCINSVDKSCALEISTSWERLVCSNGLIINESDSLRKIHNIDWMKKKKIKEYLKEVLKRTEGEVCVIRDWKNKKINQDKFKKWTDKFLKEKWGPGKAARVHHIAFYGYDGKLCDNQSESPVYLRNFKEESEVPGQLPPIRNLFQLSQALSWVAGTEKSFEERRGKQRQIPNFIDKYISYRPKIDTEQLDLFTYR